MLSGSPIMAFLATANADQARAFYQDTLGLTLTEDHEFALVFDSGGTPLRIQKVQAVSPAPYTALGWQVQNIRDAIRRLNDRGVSFERYPWLVQDELGVWTTPDGAAVAWFKDPDGNLLSLTQGPG